MRGKSPCPTPAQLERIAATRPRLIDGYVAVFVFQWMEVLLVGSPLHGTDQVGTVRLVPTWTARWGMDKCLALLREARNGDLEIIGAS